MIKFVDDFLNKITMYRLVLYFLLFLLGVALTLCLFRIFPFDFFSLLLTAVLFISFCWIFNTGFAKVFKAPTNLESVYITASILTLIVTPIKKIEDLLIVCLISLLAIGSKYIVAINKKHIFNPAAFGVTFALILNFGFASWWIGVIEMLPFILVGGFLIARKIKALKMLATFFITALLTTLTFNFLEGGDILETTKTTLLYSQLFFFGFVMFTEPLTSPPNLRFKIMYGLIVGFGFAPQVHLGPFYTSPEISLLLGNLFSYIVSPKEKLILYLKEKIQTAPETFDYVFKTDKKLNFSAGQYLEWTLPHKNSDSRGVRRYFTVASSPTEDDLRIGIKFYPNSSSFKKKLFNLKPGDKLTAGQLSGDFTLPKDQGLELCFIAGGIGVTPFRSMVEYLLNESEKRDIVILYSAKQATEFVYKNIFDEARKLGIKTDYIVGQIDEKLIQEKIPDFKDRIFYISGPHSMVDAFEKTLKQIGVKDIKVDFFPGYA